MKAHMKNAMSTSRTFVLAASLVALSLSACTKAKETKSTVDPNAYTVKADYEGKIFSLVRGVEEADSNNAVGAIPGFSQDFGFVQVRITESEIQFIELFNLENKAETQEILAAFKIKDHFDVRRDVNDYGETTHKIVEVKDRPWRDRQFMRVDWSQPSTKKSALSASTDYPDAPVESVVLLSDPTNENGHISWLTEFSAPGASGWWGVSSASRVVTRTHLMPVKKTDFERVNYREADFARFGYFFTQQNVADPEKGLTDSKLQEHIFANLHNVCEPGRKAADGTPLSCSTNQIVWHLTKNYPDKYLKVTRQVVSEWNQAFKEGLNRADDVVVLDESFAVDFVDPRFNTIAHYGAKSPGGLLGVAQETINPETGETIASRATVYEDGIRGTLGWVDDIVTMILSDDEIRQAFLATDAETKERVDKLFKLSGGFKFGTDAKTMKESLGLKFESRRFNAAIGAAKQQEVRHSIGKIANSLREPLSRSLARKSNLMVKAPELFATVEQSRLGGSISGFDDAFGLLGAKKPAVSRLPSLGGLEQLHDVGSGLREERARMVNQAQTGVHGAELVEEAALRYIKKILAAHPEADDFRKQVDAIKREVDQRTYYTTLLHEMGHTFGLRHNFHASADAKHYHPEFFRLSAQMKAEKDLPADQKTVTQADLDPYMFSSIMDYGGDFYSQVGGLGPYDRAAIKYAYNRSIDKKNDPIVKADFKFCTDHQVNESILCRRFDKGRNVSEITFNLIEDYQTNWVLSHFRRDRANFERRARSYPMGALVRYFVPVRQVMDEFLFALINPANKKVAASDKECDLEYWRKSVDNGEIVNVCDRVVAEQGGVDVTKLETFEAGLFDENGLRKENIADLEPYGLGDLLLANVLAKQFFSDVLGSTEPGMYIASQDRETRAISLEKLPDGASLDESLTAYATNNSFSSTADDLAQMKLRVGEIKVGRHGKPFNSEWDESGTIPKQKNIGAFWDKYVAMIALGIKDIGVSKYARHSMTGNAYAFPQSTAFSRQMVKAMITQNGSLSQIPFTIPGQTVMASVTPTSNLDMRAIATITALTDFVSDSDESIADQLRVCSSDEKGCLAKFGQAKVEFATSSGQDVYRAVQTLNGDSIAFDLLTAAAKIDKDRNSWVEKHQKASDVAAQNIVNLDLLEPLRESLETTLAKTGIPSIVQMIPVLLSADPQTPSVWGIANFMASQGERLPTFATMNLQEQAGGILNQAAQLIVQEIQGIAGLDQCEDALNVLAPPDPKSSPEEDKKLPAVVGLAALVNGHPNGLSALEGTPAHPPVNAANTPNVPKVDCKAIEARLAILAPAIKDFQEYTTAITKVMEGSVTVKIAPILVKRLTDELARTETNIKLIRKISKASGLE